MSAVLDIADILEIFNIQRKKVSTANRMKMREPFSTLNDASSVGPESLKNQPGVQGKLALISVLICSALELLH